MFNTYDTDFSGVTVSPNIVARFRPKTSENNFEPFTTGGYTYHNPTTGYPQHGFNFGGGVNWWVTDISARASSSATASWKTSITTTWPSASV